MNRKLLLGSLLVLTLLLLMPSIPAIQNNIVKEDIKDRILSELPEDLDFKDIPEIKKLERIKYPLLYNFIIMFLSYRMVRCGILAYISYELNEGMIITITVKRPVLFIRFIIILTTTVGIGVFWQILSNKLGWNWDLEEEVFLGEP